MRSRLVALLVILAAAGFFFGVSGGSSQNTASAQSLPPGTQAGNQGNTDPVLATVKSWADLKKAGDNLPWYQQCLASRNGTSWAQVGQFADLEAKGTDLRAIVISNLSISDEQARAALSSQGFTNLPTRIVRTGSLDNTRGVDTDKCQPFSDSRQQVRVALTDQQGNLLVLAMCSNPIGMNSSPAPATTVPPASSPTTPASPGTTPPATSPPGTTPPCNCSPPATSPPGTTPPPCNCTPPPTSPPSTQPPCCAPPTTSPPCNCPPPTSPPTTACTHKCAGEDVLVNPAVPDQVTGPGAGDGAPQAVDQPVTTAPPAPPAPAATPPVTAPPSSDGVAAPTPVVAPPYVPPSAAPPSDPTPGMLPPPS